MNRCLLDGGQYDPERMFHLHLPLVLSNTILVPVEQLPARSERGGAKCAIDRAKSLRIAIHDADLVLHQLPLFLIGPQPRKGIKWYAVSTVKGFTAGALG